MATSSLEGVAVRKLFTFQSELSKNRHHGLVASCKLKCSRLDSFCGLRGARMVYGPVHVAQFDRRPQRLTNSLAEENDTENANLEEQSSTNDQVVPGSFKVQSLLTTICDTTSIAEVELKLAGFRIYVKRDLAEKSIPTPAPALPVAPIGTPTPTPTPNSNEFAAATSLATTKPKHIAGSIQSVLDTASDEGLVILQSPKVGFFRTSRIIKGKRAPASCKEKQQVKEGQVLCYVEQLGGEIPIESDVSGEVIKILRTDGEPVGYGDALIAILPSFPGIKKLQ